MLESIRPEVERVQNLLTDTVTLLCKNGLTYDREMKVQGLLGITLDEKDCFVVHINELFSQAGAVLENVTVTGVAEGNVSLEDESSQSLSNDQMPPPPQQQTTHKKHRSSKRSHSATSDNVKVEKSDDVMIIEAKSEPGYDHGGGGGPTLAKRSRLMEQQQQENPAFTSPPQLPGGPYMAGLIAAQHQAGDGGSAGNSWDGQTNTSLALPGMNTLTSVTGNNAMLDQAAAVSWGDPNRSLGGNQLNTADSVGYQQLLLSSRRPVAKTSDNKYACTECNRRFKHTFILYRHQREKHGAAYIRPQASRHFRSSTGGMDFNNIGLPSEMSMGYQNMMNPAGYSQPNHVDMKRTESDVMDKKLSELKHGFNTGNLVISDVYRSDGMWGNECELLKKEDSKAGLLKNLCGGDRELFEKVGIDLMKAGGLFNDTGEIDLTSNDPGSKNQSEGDYSDVDEYNIQSSDQQETEMCGNKGRLVSVTAGQMSVVDSGASGKCQDTGSVGGSVKKLAFDRKEDDLGDRKQYSDVQSAGNAVEEKSELPGINSFVATDGKESSDEGF